MVIDGEVSALPQLEIKICYEGDKPSVYGTQVQGFLRLVAGGWWLAAGGWWLAASG